MKFAPLALLLLSCSASAAAPLHIQLELPKPEHGPYHRPYVAVWVEDANEKPVRLIEIWREKPDWIKDLRRFWRKTGRADPPLVDARTGATKGPGRYQLIWDGKDDTGVAVTQGDYLLVLEAAREHGGRNLVKQPFRWDESALEIKVKAGTELGEIILTKGTN
ncbi:DUF2271 domain-containing protein [Rheinheimera sp.]|uniref:DUF2271 domain-containing protein n=1 Tax=Rheinheimera sp. TaxID=1869214 RepID=UPI002FDDBD9C